jgi:hypothetical protein
MIVEEESKNTEINPDALDAVFADDAVFMEEEEVTISFFNSEDEGADEIDIAFQANDEDYW